MIVKEKSLECANLGGSTHSKDRSGGAICTASLFIVGKISCFVKALCMLPQYYIAAYAGRCQRCNLVA